jgi:predicted signal transduction protein with EAL and GGDEF domain
VTRRLTGKVVIATHNPGKLREMRELLEPYGIDVVSAGDLRLPEPEETGDTFMANALIKAHAAARAATPSKALAAARPKARERLAHLAEHDPLTGLRNRRNLHGVIDRAIAAAGEDGVALVVVDADAFKRINDELGYETGDLVLERLAALIGEAVGPGGFGARLGGDAGQRIAVDPDGEQHETAPGQAA